MKSRFLAGGLLWATLSGSAVAQQVDDRVYLARIVRSEITRLRQRVAGLVAVPAVRPESGFLGIVRRSATSTDPFAGYGYDVQRLQVYRSAGDTSYVVFPEIIVQFRPGLTDALGERHLRLAYGAMGFTRLAPRRYLVSLPIPDRVLAIVAAMAANSPFVEWAEPNYYYLRPEGSAHGDPVTNASFVNTEQWARNSAAFGLKEAWTALGIKGRSSIRVAVLDGGFDISHPSLKGRLAATVDAVAESIAQKSLGDQQKWPVPTADHGTMVAGIVAANSPGGGQGVEGVAPGASLIAIKVGELLPGGGFEVMGAATLVWGVRRAIELKADILSCSWTTTEPSHALAEELAKAKSARGGKGALALFAAGNKQSASAPSYNVGFPAKHWGVAVAASNSCHGRKAFGDCDQTEAAYWATLFENPSAPLVYAPGSKMPTTATGGKFVPSFWGTSAATPFVAGIAALMLSDNPSLTADCLIDRLRKSAATPAGGTIPVVNALRAVRPVGPTCQ